MSYPLTMGRNPAYEELLRLVIEFPMWTRLQYAQRLMETNAGSTYTKEWIGTIINSDAFQARLKKEQAELTQQIHSDVKARATSAVETTLTRLEQLMAVESDASKVTEAAEMLLDRLGFSPKTTATPAAAPTINVNLLNAVRNAYGQSGAVAKRPVIEQRMAEDPAVESSAGASSDCFSGLEISTDSNPGHLL